MKKRNDWFRETDGPGCDLRILLYEMLKECLGMASYNGEITWNEWEENIPKRPFINKFKENKKDDRVFTDSVIANFLFLCANRSEYGNDKKIKLNRNHWMNKAIGILHESKFGKAVASPQNLSILCDSSGVCDCTEAMRTGKPNITDDKCGKCSLNWLYSTLNFIEENYWQIINNTLNIWFDFIDDEHYQTVNNIYQSIKQFERESPEQLCSLDRLIELYNECNKCFEYPDVANEKVAYIKWFTARLANWPYFKKELLEINRYNEEWIYYLLSSASNILQITENADEKLIAQVESDKLISYLTLGYVKPFSLANYEHPKELSSRCIKAVERVSTPRYKLLLYIELLNFQYFIDPKYIDKYSTCISELFAGSKNSADILMLKARFELYTMLFDSSSDEQRRKTGKTINSAYSHFNKTGVIPESLDLMAYVFIQNYEHYAANEYCSTNPAVIYLSLKGVSNFNDIIFPLPQNPGRFQRIFGDYAMLKYYDDRYNSIVRYMEPLKEAVSLFNHYTGKDAR